jgi:hypothetical protein
MPWIQPPLVNNFGTHVYFLQSLFISSSAFPALPPILLILHFSLSGLKKVVLWLACPYIRCDSRSFRALVTFHLRYTCWRLLRGRLNALISFSIWTVTYPSLLLWSANIQKFRYSSINEASDYFPHLETYFSSCQYQIRRFSTWIYCRTATALDPLWRWREIQLGPQIPASRKR